MYVHVFFQKHYIEAGNTSNLVLMFLLILSMKCRQPLYMCTCQGCQNWGSHYILPLCFKNFYYSKFDNKLICQKSRFDLKKCPLCLTNVTFGKIFNVQHRKYSDSNVRPKLCLHCLVIVSWKQFHLLHKSSSRFLDPWIINFCHPMPPTLTTF